MNEMSAHRFLVTLDPADAYVPAPQALQLLPLIDAGFQEVSGLGAELEVMAYAEGGRNDFAHQLPVRHSWSRITLKRGLIRGQELWSWYQAGLTMSLGARRDGMIMLLTPDGLPAYTWAFMGGLAAKWSGPAFNSMQSQVAIESLEIAHQGIRLAMAFPTPA